jgi:hypothetical protein
MATRLLDSLRSAAAKVAQRARYVIIDYDNLKRFVADLPVERARLQPLDPRYHYYGPPEDMIAYILTLDSINFGSGYATHLHKRVDDSVYLTIALSLKERFQTRGPLAARELTRLTDLGCAKLFGQDLGDEAAKELMTHFAAALNDLGNYLLDHYQGQFSNLVEAAGSSAEELVRILAIMPYYQDISLYDGIAVPFYKRAQITAADLSLAFENRPPGFFHDLDKLTIFADNAVPHVLRLNGILAYEESLASRIDAGLLIPSNSVEEVEIRAVALHAAELLVDEIRGRGHPITPMVLDNFLWNLAQQPRYRARPRHRTRTVYY